MADQITEIVDVTITRESLPLSQAAQSTLLVAGDSDKLPENDIVVVTTDADLIADNVISLKLNGVLYSETYATSNDVTMAALAATLQALGTVATAVASGSPNRIITITAAGDETAPVVVTEAQVTLGVTQAGVTTVRTPAVRTKSYASLVAVAVDFLVTDPEYLAATAFFAQNPHPATMKIGRVGAAEDWSDALDAITNFDDAWYFLAITSRVVVDVKDVAAWADTSTKQFHTASDDSNILDSGVSSDIAAFFENLEYDRTLTMFNELAAATYPEVAWISVMATKTPGKATFAYKTLTGVTPSSLTAAQRTTVLTTKNANIYTTIAGQGETRDGKMANGEFADIVWGADSLQSQMTLAVFSVIADAEDKIPYTDEGIAAVEGAMAATLDDFIASGFLTARPDLYSGRDYEIVVPLAANVSATDKANRELNDVTFAATLAGAIHKADINGVVAV